MKTTFQTSRTARDGESVRSHGLVQDKSSAIDWSFQSQTPILRGGPGSFRTDREPAFRGLSQSFFEAEAKREDRIEGVLFGIIVVLATWPMVMAAQAALALLK